MSTETPDELPDVSALRAVDPPAGGLAILRERLDAADRPRRARWLLLAVPALAALAIWLVVRVPQHAQPVATIVPAPRSTPVADRNVGESFYWVDSTPAAAPAPATPVVTVTVEQRAVELAPINP